MIPFRELTGIAVPFGAKNVDTDLIIPGRFLKTITRAGLGKGAFSALRSDPDNIFDQPRYRGAPILIAGDNFGCGSSREHAPWALADMGFRAIIAPSFAEIFAGNAFKNGLLLISLPQPDVDDLIEHAPTGAVGIDLNQQRVTAAEGWSRRFEIDPFRKHCLWNGLDEIQLSLAMQDDIKAFEARMATERPWVA